jgi:TM2 domain-containing membrane protein YozV
MPVITRRRSHPGVAAVLSFVFNGLGQLYNGQIAKGLLIISACSVSMTVFLIGAVLIACVLFKTIFFVSQLAWGIGLLFAGLIAICVLGVYSIFDAYKAAGGK